jgi:hypothetical protein
MWLLAAWRMTTVWTWWREVRNIDAWFGNELRMTRELVAALPHHQHLIGNPSPIEPDGSYEQDYARSLGHLIRSEADTLTVADFEQYMREYCEIQKTLWRHGFGERIWNVTFNCGVSAATGRLILIDINELTQERHVMHAHIRDTHWRGQNSLTWLRKHYPHLAEVAERVLREMCTEAELERVWGVPMVA